MRSQLSEVLCRIGYFENSFIEGSEKSVKNTELSMFQLVCFSLLQGITYNTEALYLYSSLLTHGCPRRVGMLSAEVIPQPPLTVHTCLHLRLLCLLELVHGLRHCELTPPSA